MFQGKAQDFYHYHCHYYFQIHDSVILNEIIKLPLSKQDKLSIKLRIYCVTCKSISIEVHNQHMLIIVLKRIYYSRVKGSHLKWLISIYMLTAKTSASINQCVYSLTAAKSACIHASQVGMYLCIEHQTKIQTSYTKGFQDPEFNLSKRSIRFKHMPIFSDLSTILGEERKN